MALRDIPNITSIMTCTNNIISLVVGIIIVVAIIIGIKRGMPYWNQYSNRQAHEQCFGHSAQHRTAVPIICSVPIQRLTQLQDSIPTFIQSLEPAEFLDSIVLDICLATPLPTHSPKMSQSIETQDITNSTIGLAH